MAEKASFAGRILLAMVLMVGFYVLAIAIALGLFLIPVGEVLLTGHIHPKIAVLCVILGIAVLWSVMPRFERFVAPGPLLTAAEQPELFAQIESIAKAMNQQMPKAVYAVPEMNAWVGNRGGWMGIGSRRIMGLGVPLMQVLSTQQFRGVLAHEFGHYDAGDTRLSPWIYVTRSAIMRTVENLVSQGSSIVSKPFEWYARFFLRVTQKVSRQQEYHADALATKIVGPEAMASGLKLVHRHGLAFGEYWENEFVPVLSKGYRPPLVEGFRSFCGSEKVQSQLTKILEMEKENQSSDEYDSHPSLPDRTAAIEAISGPAMPPEDAPFIRLIRDVEGLEKAMIGHLATLVQVKIPDSVGWDETAEKVWIPKWQATLGELANPTPGLRLEEALERLGDQERVLSLIAPPIRQHLREWKDVRDIGLTIVATAMIVALHREGWEVGTPVGLPPYAKKGECRVEPFEIFQELREEKVLRGEVVKRFRGMGIDGLVLWV